MANTDPRNVTSGFMHNLMSRLGLKSRDLSHGYSTIATGGYQSLPSDAVEVFRGGTAYGMKSLLSYLKDNKRCPNLATAPSVTDPRAGSLLIFIGPAEPSIRLSDKKFAEILEEIDKKASTKGRSILFVPSRIDTRLKKMFDSHSMYQSSGYLDWGINYTSDKKMVGISHDVSCFWSIDHEISTIVLPEEPTVSGLLKAKTVMRKADIMVSHSPPLEAIEYTQDKYSDSEKRDSALVSEARSIWNPDLHLYGGLKTHAQLWGLGDKRMLSVSRLRSGTVLRWSRGDLEKGPINGPQGYPINERLYKVK